MKLMLLRVVEVVAFRTILLRVLNRRRFVLLGGRGRNRGFICNVGECRRIRDRGCILRLGVMKV
jgi:hypothetical protein